MQFDEQRQREFCRASDPHQWMLVASSLHEQAINLHEICRHSYITIHDPDESSVTFPYGNRATFLLASFAIENAIKAFLIYENPHYVAKGRLSRELRSHRLVELSERSALIPYRARDRWVLAAFEDGNDGWMRYPAGRDADQLNPQRNLTADLWAGYRRVMRGYSKRLIRLLEKGWTDPFGNRQHWMIGWDYFP